jgi:cellobiose phosphorylase
MYTPKTHYLTVGPTRIALLETGDIRLIESDSIMINQLPGNYLDGMTSNIYLRLYHGETITAYPLMGKAAASVRLSANHAEYTGKAAGIPYRVSLSIAEQHWFFAVRISPLPGEQTAPLRIDLVYTQDIGLGNWGHVRANEAFNAQYLDHKTFLTETGRVICSRQNQRQTTGFPFLQQGCLPVPSGKKAVSFSVDGFPFYGLSYKENNIIAELSVPALNNRIYQYEYAFSALQTEPAILDADAYEAVFYAVFLPHLETSVEHPLPTAEILAAYDRLSRDTAAVPLAPLRLAIDPANTYSSPPLTPAEMDRLYPEQSLEEREDGETLSFFTRRDAHVVMAAKEKRCERPHGNIIITGKNDFAREDVLTSTQFIYGVFNSHIALGNTSFNKIISNCRNALNTQKISGQRLMVRINGEYRLLAMPAVFEMGMNYSRWLYKIDAGEAETDTLEITAFIALEKPLLSLHVQSRRGRRYDFLLYTQLTGGADEYADPPPVFSREGNQITLRHSEAALSAQEGHYPEMRFILHVDRDFSLSDERRFFAEPGNIAPSLGESLMVMEFRDTEGFSYTLEGRLDGEPLANITMDFETEAEAYYRWIREGINHFSLSLMKEPGKNAEGPIKSCGFTSDPQRSVTEHIPAEGVGRNLDPAVESGCPLPNLSTVVMEQTQLEALNVQALWYSHNARIHFASPHGLEQYGGAAWGVRDVCQGPFEFFLAAGNHPAARNLLLRVYAAQNDDGSWPQWFMFDRYSSIRAGESHGDVVLWPMKALTDYLGASGDKSLMEEQAPRFPTTKPTERATLFERLEKQLAHIRGKLINGTALLRYGDGDWDDTLQPADQSLRDKMASGWTNALLYQSLCSLSSVLAKAKPAFAHDLDVFAQEVRRDFHRYFLVDGVTAGFVIFEADGTRRMLLHPQDTATGLSYRLLPMTRSMTAELFDPTEAASHHELIRRHLYHPDGVRLMDTTCRYSGGVKRHFARAETAANFGREIGLQYAHAHIRFAEAMAKIGETAESWRALLQVSPVLRRRVVPNALPCQANCYFSSSDGCFDNRYEATAHFDQLRTGEISVKTGWRLYSSGPGIYLNQLVSNVLGLRAAGDWLLIDPVLPEELDGLRFVYAFRGRPLTVVYHTGGKGVEKILINGRDTLFEQRPNPYRRGGAALLSTEIPPNAELEVFL